MNPRYWFFAWLWEVKRAEPSIERRCESAWQSMTKKTRRWYAPEASNA